MQSNTRFATTLIVLLLIGIGLYLHANPIYALAILGIGLLDLVVRQGIRRWRPGLLEARKTQLIFAMVESAVFVVFGGYLSEALGVRTLVPAFSSLGLAIVLWFAGFAVWARFKPAKAS